MSGQAIDSRPRLSAPLDDAAPLGERPHAHFALSWSGGKDSALALWTLRRQLLEPEALITTVTETYERISMHGVRRELLVRQAEVLGIPLVEVLIPPGCVNEAYEARMAEAFADTPLSGVEAVAFGDLFLEDVAPTGRDVLPRPASARSYRSGGTTRLRSRASSSTPASRRRSSASTRACSTPPSRGDATTNGWLAELAPGVDPCGENGEFHTFVSAGPIFAAPIAFERGEIVERDGFVFRDLTPA